MNKQIPVALLIVACLGALLFWSTTTMGQPPAAKTKWEYKISSNLTEQQLNTLGGEGWELAAVNGQGIEFSYFLKRPK